MMQAPDWFTTAVNEAKARVAQWPPELQQIASASLPSLEQQLAHEKHQADRIAELEREIEALRKDAQGSPRCVPQDVGRQVPQAGAQERPVCSCQRE